MDERKYTERHPWDDGIYGTGRTNPPKSHGGLIALLLILVILLSGIVGILSALNIRLFSQLQAQKTEQNAITFTDRGSIASFLPDETNAFSFRQPDLGIDGESISAFYQVYYRIPPGLYVTRVDEDSDAALQGITYGDILTHIDGNPITDLDSFNALLTAYQAGDTVQVSIYRRGNRYTLTLILQGN